MKPSLSLNITHVSLHSLFKILHINLCHAECFYVQCTTLLSNFIQLTCSIPVVSMYSRSGIQFGSRSGDLIRSQLIWIDSVLKKDKSEFRRIKIKMYSFSSPRNEIFYQISGWKYLVLYFLDESG